MFEGLIEFVEDTLLTRINLIMSEEKDTLVRCQAILQLLLTFAERNPGITRVMTGDALMGEHDRLRGRIDDLFNRIEAQLKQVLREKALREKQKFTIDEGVLANMLRACRWQNCPVCKVNFKRLPTERWWWQSVPCNYR